MSLVVDTSVIISVITNEVHKAKLIRATKGEELIAPISLHWEIANAFSAMFKQNRISLELAKEAIEYYSQIKIRFVEIDLNKALDIAYKYNIYAYDAYFIVSAKQYKSKLISLDEGLISVAKQNKIITIEVWDEYIHI